MGEAKRQVKRLDGPVRQVRRPESFKSGGPADIPVNPAIPPVVDQEAGGGVVLPAQTSRPKSKFRAAFTKKRLLAATSLSVVCVFAFVGVKAVLATKRVIQKSSERAAPALSGPVDPTKLKGEGDGRINILLLGTGGSGHDGGNLSDTIMVASIDPKAKTIAMLSIPRDMYVRIPGYGYSKINAANAYGGPDLAKQVVSKILDLPIHYYVQADFSGFKQAVDAVGGVDINNKEKLYDSAYPCDNDRGFCPFSLPVGQYHMDGKLALKFARCRHGLCGNDFGRAARQQQLLVALRQKALEASTLTNPVKIGGLIDSVGSHAKTDLQLKELEKLAVIVKDLDTSKTQQKVLDMTPAGLLVDGSSQFPGAGSIEIPRAGAFNYSEIQALAHTIFVDGYLKQEAAAIEIQNGTTKVGMAAAVTKQLQAYSYNVVATLSAPTNDHQASTIIDYSGGKKPYTLQYLEKRFGIKAGKAVKPTTLSAGETQIPDIVVIIGANYKLPIPTTP
ncbi:MAG TPA: LCP family protein [Candidatus Saccharimonadales bacterium]|nr:LCP family protein [Candidatus Saccharimonadales bacterium]